MFLVTLIIISKIFLIIIPLLIFVGILTFVERKVIAAMQLRRGPNVVGPFGFFQPIADGLKLLTKEIIIPYGSDKYLFLIAPVITFVLSLIGWAVIPFDKNIVLSNINVGILYLFAVSTLSVYGVIIAGWASNSKYAFLGAMRSTAQMISYEVSIGLIIISVLLSAGSLNLTEIVLAQKNFWYFIPHFPMAVIFFISTIAETNRAPFDLPEAEAELVSGFHVEYSSFPFALFFLGEYANIVLMSALSTILFFGGWLPPFNLEIFYFVPGYIWFFLKVSFFVFLFFWIRATLPRFRYDQLMRLGWKIFLPLSLLLLFLTSTFLVIFKYV